MSSSFMVNKNAQNQIQLSHDAWDAIPDKFRILSWCWEQRRLDELMVARQIEQEGLEGKAADKLWNGVQQRFGEDMRQWFWSHYRNYVNAQREQYPEYYETQWVQDENISTQ